jgi:ribosomal protein S18 acetylase RimI-like enzyme
MRDAVADDRPAVYAVCLRTGNAGGDASSTYVDRDLLGHVYAGPYLELEPELAIVLNDGAGAEGYVLGALDTRRFEARCEQEWWPSLRARYPLGSFPGSSPDERLVRMMHAPVRAPETVVAAYPSHLHIDLLPRWQGGGWGRRLVETLLDRLVARGSSGVHLGVARSNERAIGFYRRLGFSDVQMSADAVVMGRRLTG